MYFSYFLLVMIVNNYMDFSCAQESDQYYYYGIEKINHGIYFLNKVKL